MKKKTKRTFWLVIAEFGIIFAGINLAIYLNQSIKSSFLNLLWTLIALIAAILVKIWNNK